MKLSLKQYSLTLLFVLGLLISVLSVQAEDTSTGDALPTEEPTSEVVPSETPVPTDLPIETPIPTETPAEISPLPTSEPTLNIEPTVEPEAPVVIDPTPVPPVLPLAYSTSFDASFPVEVSGADQWLDVSVNNGKALQSTGQAASSVYQAATFLDGAVEASLFLNGGEGSVLLRDYAARLTSDGLLTLTHGGTLLGSAQVTSTAATWAKIRLTVIGTSVQVSLNDVNLITVADSVPSLEGQAGFAASEGSALRVDDFAVYGIPVTVLPLPAPTETVVPTVAPIDPTPVVLTPAEESMPSLPQAGETLTLVVSTTLADKITLSWNDLTTEEHYVVEQSLDGGALWESLVQTNADVTGYDIESLSCGEVRLLRVRGIIASPYEELASSSHMTGRTTPCTSVKPLSPVGGPVFTDDITPVLRWTAVQNATAYEIDLALSNSFSQSWNSTLR